ncbi:hypothetical protein BJY14_007701 [Actinomadura luteofluorescens]|uniref:Uncharacterized protein n=1 Tax=Actinomadura luteofluorescens TaxID=46163 RepID=A0A7Y9EPU3_9ACTN|nr:hypothetical protein [Actinomadura luteofluorescens]NYD51718.1 hypothetical protein [Actinomadura luteofluorescens]
MHRHHRRGHHDDTGDLPPAAPAVQVHVHHPGPSPLGEGRPVVAPGAFERQPPARPLVLPRSLPGLGLSGGAFGFLPLQPQPLPSEFLTQIVVERFAVLGGRV